VPRFNVERLDLQPVLAKKGPREAGPVAWWWWCCLLLHCRAVARFTVDLRDLEAVVPPITVAVLFWVCEKPFPWSPFPIGGLVEFRWADAILSARQCQDFGGHTLGPPLGLGLGRRFCGLGLDIENVGDGAKVPRLTSTFDLRRNAITAADIATAVAMNDLDDACRHLQNIAGITDGGVAGMCFSDINFDWASATLGDREVKIRGWLQTERAMSLTQ
jgi:hypothetical protein